MNYEKEIFVKDYFDIHNFYAKIYGNKTIILMQVGSFHECYATDNEGLDLFILSEKLDIIVTKKNKNKPLSRSNPRMMGFPIYVIDDFTEKLVNFGYTIVIIDQTTEPPNPKREVTGIYSPTTFLQKNTNYSTTKSTNLICIIIDALKTKSIKQNQIPILCIGISAYDLTTGNGSVYETVSTAHDPMYALDDAIRFLENYPPCEVIFDCTKNLTEYLEQKKNINNMTLNDIISYLGLSQDEHQLYKIQNITTLSNIKYQTNLLESIYNHHSNLSCIEDLNLNFYNLARLSLVALLEYTKNHQQMLLQRLKKPLYFSSKTKLFLGNKALDQLDVIPHPTKPKTLFNIINFTRTVLGKRFLKNSISNPLIDMDAINYRYNIISQILENNLHKEISDNLIDIADLQKLNRRMELGNIHPMELFNVYMSIDQIIKTINSIKKYKKLYQDLDYKKEYIDKINGFTQYIDNTFNVDYIMELNFLNYKEESFNFIKSDKYPRLIELEENIKLGENFMDYLIKELEKVIMSNAEKRFMKKDNKLITLKYNDRDGHYLMVTQKRCKVLIDSLKKQKIIKIGKTEIKFDDLEFIDMPRSTYTKIYCKEMKTISTNVVQLKNMLAKETKVAFYLEIKEIVNNFIDALNYFVDKISFLDFINSGALCSHKFGYCKPNIIPSDKSFFDVENMRHPIVEIINQDTEYHPHTLSIGKDLNGILLYGINSSGKSTLMKAIGLNIILAQIGYFVSATKFEYFPYTNLFTRICGNDNIFRGMSSFMVEMVELMAILKRNNNRTLVLGDEICRGTEEKSANIIVAYMLETLSESDTSFITATHLHMIAELPCVVNLKHVKPMHLKVEYDDINQSLVYNRELTEGQGEKYYGVQVAKYLMKNDHFNLRTKEIENEYEDISVKQSNYNKNNWMIECYFCHAKKELETHHINFQKDCTNNMVIDKPHIKKNSNYNLVTLCRKCHDMVDTSEIIINGWLDTSNGIILDYYHQDKKLNKKYNQEAIDDIKKYKGTISLLKAKKLIEKNYQINISTSTISKIWNNVYKQS
jgi:DNA mismatch repair protein MutS